MRSVFFCGIRYSVHGGYILKINCPVLLHRCGRVAECLFLVKTNFVSTPITRSCQWLLCLVDTAHCASLLHYVTLRHITLMFKIPQFWHRYHDEYTTFGECACCWKCLHTLKLHLCLCWFGIWKSCPHVDIGHLCAKPSTNTNIVPVWMSKLLNSTNVMLVWLPGCRHVKYEEYGNMRADVNRQARAARICISYDK